MMQSTWLWIECTAIYIAVPAVFALGWLSTPTILLPLVLLCLPVALWIGRREGFSSDVFWRGDVAQERQHLYFIVGRFLLSAFVLSILGALLLPWPMFRLPLHMPLLWMLIIIGYPLVSVFPQELLFRGFFFRRYRGLFRHDSVMVAVNALLFSWMHIVFFNLTAVALSFIGGWFFATTYMKSRSLRLVCLEHALYGVLLFTIGYGRLFVFESDSRLFAGHLP